MPRRFVGPRLRRRRRSVRLRRSHRHRSWCRRRVAVGTSPRPPSRSALRNQLRGGPCETLAGKSIRDEFGRISEAAGQWSAISPCSPALAKRVRTHSQPEGALPGTRVERPGPAPSIAPAFDPHRAGRRHRRPAAPWVGRADRCRKGHPAPASAPGK